MPCAGPDAETDSISQWVSDVKISEICKVNVDRIPIIKSKGISSVIKKRENWFIALKDQVKEGDLVSVKRR